MEDHGRDTGFGRVDSTQPCGCDPGLRLTSSKSGFYNCKRYPDCAYGGSLFGLPGAPVKRLPETTKTLQAAHPADHKLWRKQRPLYSGVINYFRDALMEVAFVSFIGNEQHNPGEPLHWAREKSTDHLDCIVRHTSDHGLKPVDDDGGYHLAKVAWRALAELQLYLEQQKESK